HSGTTSRRKSVYFGFRKAAGRDSEESEQGVRCPQSQTIVRNSRARRSAGQNQSAALPFRLMILARLVSSQYLSLISAARVASAAKLCGRFPLNRAFRSANLVGSVHP